VVVREPFAELVTLALLTRLREIEGDGGLTRWYTPTVVTRAGAFVSEGEESILDTSIEGDKVILLLIPDTTEDEDSTYTEVSTTKAYDLVALKVFDPAIKSPLHKDYDTEENPTRETVQNRLEADCKNQLRGNLTLEEEAIDFGANQVLHITIPMTNKSEEDTWIEGAGWAAVFMRIEVQCNHADTAA
jgi:hypothetical protein